MRDFKEIEKDMLNDWDCGFVPSLNWYELGKKENTELKNYLEKQGFKFDKFGNMLEQGLID